MLTKEMKKVIEESGRLLEFRVTNYLRGLGYYTIPNYAYQDPETEESKVIDIKAVSAERIEEETEESIFPVIFIECKNIKVPLVFFVFQEPRIRPITGRLHLSGTPKKIRLKRGQKKDLLDYLEIEKFHHYYKSRKWSSHFIGILREKNRYVVTHDLKNQGGNLYQTVIFPLIKAIHYDKKIYEETLRPGVIDLQFYYPIFIVPGPLYECFLGENKKPIYKAAERVVFGVQYESAKMQTDYFIDIVTEKGFPHLLAEIEKETRKIGKLIKREREELMKNVYRVGREKYGEYS